MANQPTKGAARAALVDFEQLNRQIQVGTRVVAGTVIKAAGLTIGRIWWEAGTCGHPPRYAFEDSEYHGTGTARTYDAALKAICHSAGFAAPGERTAARAADFDLRAALAALRDRVFADDQSPAVTPITSPRPATPAKPIAWGTGLTVDAVDAAFKTSGKAK